MELIQENVVLTANSFNVTLLTQMWLVNNGIVMPEEFDEGGFFTPGMVQFSTAAFHFLAIPNQVQFTLVGEEGDKARMVSERLGRLAGLLPHTPFVGLGINFTWIHRADLESVRAVGRRLFLKEDNPLAMAFDTVDAKFGAYYSADVAGFRLKLSALPVSIGSPADGEGIQFAFNYHRDVREEGQIREALARWRAAKDHASAIIERVGGAL